MPLGGQAVDFYAKSNEIYIVEPRFESNFCNRNPVAIRFEAQDLNGQEILSFSIKTSGPDLFPIGLPNLECVKCNERKDLFVQ